MNRLCVMAKMALETARAVLPLYSHPKSPKKFTQPQLVACLVLRAHLKQTYRGIEELLEVSDALRRVLELKQVPDHATLQKFSQRIVKPEVVDRVLGAVLQVAKPATDTVAMDSTGLEPTARSAYYQTRRGTPRKHYVKLSLAVLCGSLLPCSLVVGRGPANDKREAPQLLAQAAAKVQPKRLLADAGYDAEWIHEFCRRQWKARSYIPLVVHRRDGSVGGHWRSKMVSLPKLYGQRWHVESFISGLKRTTGSQLASRKPNLLDNEAALRVLAYAIRR